MKIATVVLIAGSAALAGESVSATKNEVQLYAGFFNFDLMGVGTENHLGLGYAYSMNNSLAIKTSASFVKTHQQYVIEVPYLISEIGIEVGKEMGLFRPYLGGGTGLIFDVRGKIRDSVSFVAYMNSGNQLQARVETVPLEKGNRVDASFYSEAGLKIKLPNQATYVNASIKVRAHEVDFSGLSSELSIGLGSLF